MQAWILATQLQENVCNTLLKIFHKQLIPSSHFLCNCDLILLNYIMYMITVITIVFFDYVKYVTYVTAVIIIVVGNNIF